jgi:hypothetical protein
MTPKGGERGGWGSIDFLGCSCGYLEALRCAEALAIGPPSVVKKYKK